MSTELASAFEAERMNIAVEAPELSRALVALEREFRIDPVLRELVKLRASILNGCAYCIDLHTKDARKADESEQRL
jgi:AhpD family alkylhydroperoxidase